MKELFYSRKKVISVISINMLHIMTGLSPGIIFRIINDINFLKDLSSLIESYDTKHRRKLTDSTQDLNQYQ
jgi:hypothetical protein